MIAGLEGCSDLGPRSECAQWEAVGDAFSRDQDVGIDAVVLVTKHLAGASETRLDFVGNEQDAVLIENLLYFFEVIRRRHDDATLAHYGFRNEGGDIGGSGEADYVVDGPGALAATFFRVIAPLRTISVGSGGKGNARGIRTAAFFAALIAGDAESAPTASVEAGVESDELVFASKETRQLHGAFNGLGTAVAEKRLGESTGSDVCDFLREIGNWLHMVDVGRAMDELVHLGFGGRDDLGIIVASVDHGNTGEAVKVLATVDIGDGGAAGVVDDDRNNR